MRWWNTQPIHGLATARLTQKVEGLRRHLIGLGRESGRRKNEGRYALERIISLDNLENVCSLFEDEAWDRRECREVVIGNIDQGSCG